MFSWLTKRGVALAGPAFIRYLVINMATKLDLELGFPVQSATAGEGRIKAGALPAGRYAALTYTGDYSVLMSATATLLDWGAKQGLVWDSRTAKEGDAFGSRFESYISGPGREPDPEKWRTVVAIRLADDQRPK